MASVPVESQTKPAQKKARWTGRSVPERRSHQTPIV
ncbi:hypothetical protein HNQ05_000678 [Oceanithermus desulfurans]|uniref:Uncharacterized protein n=1 Tax=Oceanithermus desulfurans TaxID=227924 RepID=A0ABR6NZY9_9DEIN|nr:hypothetical protein [Oceanithermus desulfurans]